MIAISFSEKGRALSETIKEKMPEEVLCVCRKGMHKDTSGGESLSALCQNAFEEKTALLFIGAMGIAIRLIAPFVRDKMTDPPVIVMDETGTFCIPVLSGHIGGANELALRLSEAVGAVPVITTATDVQGAFSVDLFAKEHGLFLENREGIAKVSGKALEGKAVTLSIKDYPPAEPVDVLITDEAADDSTGTVILRGASFDGFFTKDTKQKYVIGIGCKKGKDPEALKAFVAEQCAAFSIAPGDILALATIEQKQKEPAITALSKEWRLPLIVFDVAVLNKVPGTFSASAFVKAVTGTDNVCERAALLAAGAGGTLFVNKQAKEGMTIAIAERGKEC